MEPIKEEQLSDTTEFRQFIDTQQYGDKIFNTSISFVVDWKNKRCFTNCMIKEIEGNHWIYEEIEGMNYRMAFKKIWQMIKEMK